MRNLGNVGGKLSTSVVLAVSSIASMPCFGHKSCRLITDSPCLLEIATNKDVDSVVNSLSEAPNDIAIVMRGLLASLTVSNGSNQQDSSRNTDFSIVGEFYGTKLPEAYLGTALEILMSSIHKDIERQNDVNLTALLGCLQTLALPDQFSVLVEALTKGEDLVKTAGMTLLVSQIKGRPRAVFDGRDFVKFAFKICKMPVLSIRKLIGEEQAAEIFIDSFGEMLTKFLSQEVEIVIENIFRFCISQFDRNSSLTITFLRSIERILQQAIRDKSPRFSPKCLKSLHLFLHQRAFSGIHGAASSTTNDSTPFQMTKIIEAYTNCIVLIPDNFLTEKKIFGADNRIGFSAECLRIRLLMHLIQNKSCSVSSRSYQEVVSSITWVTQQLIAGADEILSPAFLQVACAIATASSRETKKRKKEIIVAFLDNLLMVDANASFICLEILSAFVFEWCHGHGSDGDLSLLRALGPSIETWVDLPQDTLKKTFQLAVHDLPFNLARFARREKLLDVIFNRLSRVYTKWVEQGSDEKTRVPLKLSLMCCRDAETVTNAKDLAELVTSIVLETK